MKRKYLRYKGIRVNAFGIPVSGYVDKSKGKKPIKKRDIYHTSFPSVFKENSPKNLIVMYDIPHELKKERDWFRRHLIKFGYKMIQKSVWVGPSPLPKEFLKYLEEIKIGNRLKTLKLAKTYNPTISAMA
ncbi:MAG: CRISPR-associated endonuclease Cas2 [Minisyncoccia bacterium]